MEHKVYGNGRITLLFIHGGGVNLNSYKDLLIKLGEKFKVIAINLPGVGKTPATKSINETIDNINSFINSLTEKEIVIVGHSFGGAIADVLSQRNHNIIREILIDCTVFKSPKNIFELFLRMCIKTINGIIKYKNLRNFNLKAMKFQLASTLFDYKNFVSHVSQSIKNTIHPLVLTNKSRVKRLILWGKNDELSPVKDIPIDYIDQIEIVEGNHDWCIGNSDLAARKIIDFVMFS